MIWWVLLHAVLAASALLLELAPVLVLLGLAAIVAHGIARYPRGPKLLVLQSDGTWAVPERGWHGLKLAPGTAWTTWYVELALSGQPKARIVLLRDQLCAEDWRVLQLAVREHVASRPASTLDPP
jgi:hypothetical protein